jgi:hypothetical protein
MENKMNRRGFFSAVGKFMGLAAVAPAVLGGIFSNQANAQEKRRSAGPDASAAAGSMIDTNSPIAKAVKYVEDFQKSPTSKGNKCATCGFYAKKEMHGATEVGTCTIFAGKLVNANGFCASWNKKA